MLYEDETDFAQVSGEVCLAVAASRQPGGEGGLSAEPRYLRCAATTNPSIPRHLFFRHVGGRRDALDFELELVNVRRPAQRLVNGDEPLLIEVEDGLIEGLHPVL